MINEIGVGPRFREAVRRGSIRLRDSTCPAIHAGLQAGEKGQPFVAMRGIHGSDLLATATTGASSTTRLEAAGIR